MRCMSYPITGQNEECIFVIEKYRPSVWLGRYPLFQFHVTETSRHAEDASDLLDDQIKSMI